MHQGASHQGRADLHRLVHGAGHQVVDRQRVAQRLHARLLLACMRFIDRAAQYGPDGVDRIGCQHLADVGPYLADVEHPSYLQRPGTEIATPAHAQPAAPELLDAVTVMLRISAELGRHLTAEEHTFMHARFKDDGNVQVGSVSGGLNVSAPRKRATAKPKEK